MANGQNSNGGVNWTAISTIVAALITGTAVITVGYLQYSQKSEAIREFRGRSSAISRTGVAIVFDPPSNVRESPNGRILCSVREKTTIDIYGSTSSWYYTDVCGNMGVIDSSQITFKPN